MKNRDIIYEVSPDDRLISVGDSWDDFALANNGHAILAQNVIQRPLWDFLRGETLREVYRLILKRVRNGYDFSFDYRCDSPGSRRHLRMEMTLIRKVIVHFRSISLHEEKRSHVPLFPPYTTQSKNFLLVCSWCNKVQVNQVWVEIEVALERLSLLQSHQYPQLSHGMCETCYNTMLTRLMTSPNT